MFLLILKGLSRCSGLIVLILFSFFILTNEAQATVVLKLMAINPSKEQTQMAQVKAYLPKEVKPDDVIDREDLELEYDTQQGSYFVYGEYELGPGEVLEKQIELKDLWVIPSAELESLRLEAVRTAKMLDNTDFKERAVFLKESIESKLDQIVEKQRVPATNPEKHISEYRDNLRLLEAVKEDLVVARSLLSQAKPTTSIAVWRMFFIIVAFLGVLGVSFYLIWHKQLKVINEPTFGAKESSEAETSTIEKREAKREQKVGVEDIERIIKEETK